MLRWIVFGCGAVALGGAAWYFGRPEPAATMPIAVAASAVTADESKDATPVKLMEVIDLARAYEPAPEPEEFTPGGADVVQFIPEPGAPAHMPAAAPDPEDEGVTWAELLRIVRETHTSSFSLWERPVRERIDVMPREVLTYERLDGDIGP
ncbi:MAG TPA: hypothetical protein VKE40_02415 [Gemmataceae bacterium]|nr:hypothetical protein [Gemmataceae bacterium]